MGRRRRVSNDPPRRSRFYGSKEKEENGLEWPTKLEKKKKKKKNRNQESSLGGFLFGVKQV